MSIILISVVPRLVHKQPMMLLLSVRLTVCRISTRTECPPVPPPQIFRNEPTSELAWKVQLSQPSLCRPFKVGHAKNIQTVIQIQIQIQDLGLTQIKLPLYNTLCEQIQLPLTKSFGQKALDDKSRLVFKMKREALIGRLLVLHQYLFLTTRRLCNFWL